MSRPLGILALALALVVACPRLARAGATVIDDFESASSPAPWTFTNGPEFPGATGSLASGPGQTGKGAALAYDFTGGGHYVGMVRTLTSPLAAAALGFWVRSPAGVRIRLRVVDAGGQTLQYDLSRPLAALDATAWYAQAVDLSSSASHWGGANDGVVHGGVTQVELIAGDPLEAGAAGTVGFDTVVALSAVAVALDPFAGTLDAPPAGVTDLTAGLGVNIHFTSDDRALDIARAAGFTWVRMDLSWSYTEKSPGVYDFSAYDALVASLDARAMKALFILDYGNPLYGCGPPITTAAIDAFAAWARAAAAHFAGHGLHYEVWNEANLAIFWSTCPSTGCTDASQYVALASAAIPAVHAGDPAAPVSTVGLSGFAFPFLESMLAGGAAASANAVGVHPYRQGAPETFTDELLAMRADVAAHVASDPPVWDTEWGYSSTWYGSGTGAAPRLRQAIHAVRRLVAARAAGLPYPVYYDIRDDGTDPANSEDNFGLIANDYSDKPAIQAVRAMVAAAGGRRFAGSLETGFAPLHALRFDGASDTVVMLWDDELGSSVPVTLPRPSAVTDMLGNPVSLPSGDAGSSVTLPVAESAGPIYLTFAASTPGDGGRRSGMDAPSGEASIADPAASDGGGAAASDQGVNRGRLSGGCACRAAERAPVSSISGGWLLLAVAVAAWLIRRSHDRTARRRHAIAAGPPTCGAR